MLLGWIGSVLLVARLTPQPLRLHRTGDCDGVSVQAHLVSLVSDLGWFGYGLATDLTPVWVGSAAAIALELWTLGYLRSVVTVRQLAVAGGWGGALILGWYRAGALGLGLVLAISVIVVYVPHVWVALRQKRLGGLAPATWWFALADAALWGGYGFAAGDVALVAYGLVLGVSAAVVLTAIWLKRRPHSAPAFAPLPRSASTGSRP